MDDQRLGRRPALRFVLLLVAGILIGDVVPLDAHIAWCLLVLLLFLSLYLLKDPKYFVVSNCILQCCVLGLGFTLQLYQQQHDGDVKVYPLMEDEPITVEGSVDSDPVLQGTKLNFLLRSEQFERARQRPSVGRSVERRLLTLVKTEHVRSLAANLVVGSHLRVRGVILPIPVGRNPGEFDYGKYLELNDVQGMIAVRNDADIVVLRAEGDGSFDAWVSVVRKQSYAIFDRFHSAQHSAFLKGIILGYRADISADVKESFLDTGTIHILAVSGSNVAFVSLIIYSVLGLFRLPKKVVFCATMTGLFLYMLLTGSSASVVRATVMAFVVLCGSLFERRTDVYNSLSVSAIILLLVNPTTLWDPGFQLSYAAVLSIVYFYPKLDEIRKRIPWAFAQMGFFEGALKLFAVSLAAQLGTIPFSAYYFGKISIVSLLANLIVVPMSGLNTFLGAAETFFSFVSPWLARSYVIVNDVLIWFLLWFVKTAASVPFAYVDVVGLNALFPVLYYPFVVGIFHIHRAFVARAILILSLLALDWSILANVVSNSNPRLTVTAIDVGQGDATLIRFPNGRVMLVDAGPKSVGYDAGERIVGPFLRKSGIRRIDALVVSHGHSDHLGGIPYLLAHFSVRTLLEGDTIAHSRLESEMIDVARERGVPLVIKGAGSRIDLDGTTRIYVVHPRFPFDRSRNLNNQSVVLKIVYGETSMLLAGDSELPAEEKISRRYGSFLSSGLLKAGHHGSRTSSGPAFLHYVGPRTALVSVGTKNKFHHPSPEVMQRMQSMNVAVMRTDREGAVIFQSDGKQWHRILWR